MARWGDNDHQPPVHFYVGLLLIGLFWWINWSFEGVRSHWAFAPLWLGYILAIDGLIEVKSGGSVVKEVPTCLILLFLVSAPIWWLFEALNEIGRYWIYLGKEHFSALEYAFYSSLSFSTVLPAVLLSAHLFYSFSAIKESRLPFRFDVGMALLSVMEFLGLAMLVAYVIWPDYTVPFLWISIYFILEPINYQLGYPTLLRSVGKGWIGRVVALFIGSLTCGFFWELWNYYSYPKWIYDLPFWNFWHLFEMPLMGYLGYLPFALELFAIYSLISGLLFSGCSYGKLGLLGFRDRPRNFN